MMTHLKGFVAPLIAGQIMFGAEAHATAQRTLDESEITVTGASRPQLQKEAVDYVTEVGIATSETPAARWVEPVCPRAVGLTTPAIATQVEAQVRAIAARAGAPLAKAKCRGNLMIVFSGDAPGLVNQLSKRMRLGTMAVGERERLETSALPVRWWYNHETLGEDGMPEMDLISPALQLSGSANVGGINNTFIASRKSTNSKKASIIATSGMRAIRHATVVVDITGAEGKSLSSVVDFAAMVGLAEIKLDAAPPNSILGLFGVNAIPRMSANDVALLKGLYSMPLARKAHQHRRSLITSIVKSRLSNGEQSTEQ